MYDGPVTAEQQLSELSVFVHGVLAFGHALGFMYNWRRQNRLDCLIHAGALTYDIWALRQHLRDLLPNGSPD